MASSPELPNLTVLGGPSSGEKFAFEDGSEGALIGSDSSCNFRIDQEGVSPIHARISYGPAGLLVHDTQSPRGLYVNDDRVEHETPLRNGDILWLGKPGEAGVVMIQCRVPPRAAAAVPVAAEPEPEPTLAITPDPTPVPTPAPSFDSAATVVRSVGDDSGADAFFGGEDMPLTLRVDPPPITVVPEFEDETTEVRPDPDSEPEAMMPTLITALPPIPPPASHSPEPPEPSEPTLQASAPTVSVPPPMPAPPKPAAPPPSPRVSPPPAARPPRTTSPPPAPRPAAPPPSPRRAPSPPVAPAAGAVPKRAAARQGGGGSGLKIAAAILVLGGAAAAAAFFFFLKPQATAPVPVASSAPPTAATQAPTTAAAAPATAAPAGSGATEAPATAPPSTLAPPEPVEVVTIVKNPTVRPPAATAASPRPTTRAPATSAPSAAPAGPSIATQVAGFKSQAESALAAGQFEAAVTHYDEALKLAPQDEQAVSGRARAAAARDAARKRFVAGITSVRSSKASKAQISGFESSDVKVTEALDYSGRLDFEAQPEHVAPGTPYAIKVWLTNDGKKAWRISGVETAAITNGTRAAVPFSTTVKEVAPQEKVQLGAVTGSWSEGLNSWQLEVTVNSNRGDSFKSTLSWR